MARREAGERGRRGGEGIDDAAADGINDAAAGVDNAVGPVSDNRRPFPDAYGGVG